MNWLYLATLTELREKSDEIFWRPTWDAQDYREGEQALSAIRDELNLRKVWSE